MIVPGEALFIHECPYQAQAGREKEFEKIYGPEGDWVELFRKSKAFLHTEVYRDLETSGGTFVNGQRITSSPLSDRDILGLGPVQFRMALPRGFEPSAELAAQRQALRVQAAAVVSQQAALLEESSDSAERGNVWAGCKKF